MRNHRQFYIGGAWSSAREHGLAQYLEMKAVPGHGAPVSRAG